MTKENLIKFIDFDSQDEKEECLFYLDVKGVEIHRQIMQYLAFDFVGENKIRWCDIAQKLKEDKRLRDKLYIYLATLEEYIRAYISNKYSESPIQSFWIDGKMQWNKIKSNLQSGQNLFSVLQDTDFGTLIKQVKVMPAEDKQAVFESLESLDSNLDAVVDLRNAVSHHKFLLEHPFKKCEVNGYVGDSLQDNVKNLRQLLPKQYRYGKNGKGGITADMLKCGLSI